MAAATPPAESQAYGTIVVIGGGCYGSYYVRQLRRARDAGRVWWARCVVVDRDAACPMARDAGDDVEFASAEWEPFLAHFLDNARGARDAIVPSPLMPHLLFDWVLARARARWPSRTVTTAMPAALRDVPWQREGGDGTRYASFATWMCPVNCIEPHTCPHTRSERTWSFPPSLAAHMAAERVAGGALDGPAIFHCTHRVYGVGMIDVSDILRAEAIVAHAGRDGRARVLVGTVSHCHGAVGEIVVEP